MELHEFIEKFTPRDWKYSEGYLNTLRKEPDTHADYRSFHHAIIGVFDIALQNFADKICEKQREKCNDLFLEYYSVHDKDELESNMKNFYLKGKIDILSGSFPCQKISIAGKKEGLYADGLFPEFIRAIDESRPRYAVWENVGNVRVYLPEIETEFSKIRYCLQWVSVCASWFGFPHKRERIFGIAHNTDVFGWAEIQNVAANIEKAIHEASQREFSRATCRTLQLENYAEFLRMDDGLSTELGEAEINAYGNAIVHQIAYQIFKTINEINQTK